MKVASLPVFWIGALTCVSPSLGQSVPWLVFVDSESDSVCDVVNASNAELVVLADTGQLVVVTGSDLILDATFVDDDGFVLLAGVPVGVIDFAEDDDGFRTLWWTGLNGSVVEIDTFTGEPFSTLLFPSDFGDVVCDACELWDDSEDCVGDEDLDGVPDDADLCPGTPLDEDAEIDGCSCSQFDGDGDDVDDCSDDCPETPLGFDVDFGGCACFELDSDGDDVDDCVDECPDTPLNEVADEFGCSCDFFDDDVDGVNNCDDLCPDTPLNTFVYDDGCPCNGDGDLDEVLDCFDDCPGTPLGDAVDDNGCSAVIVLPPPVIIACGNLTALTLGLTFAGLASMRLTRRRAA